MQIDACGYDPAALAPFLALEEDLYRDDPFAQVPVPRGAAATLAQLSPERAFFWKGGEARYFVARDGAQTLARAAAMRDPSLAIDGVPTGLVGFFEARPDAGGHPSPQHPPFAGGHPPQHPPGTGAAKAVLDAAVAWLAERGARRVVGPMNFSTWYSYRLTTSHEERGPFLLEPYHKRWYAGFFEAAGWRPVREYATIRIANTPVRRLVRAHERSLAAGVRFRPLEPERSNEAELRTIYDLSARAFADKTAYSAIAYEDFRGLYAGAGRLLEPGLSWVGEDSSGRALGFLFAYPDLLEPLRKRLSGAPGPHAVTTTILKTIGVVPADASGRGVPPGLGWALCYLHIQAAREKGYTHALYALMEKTEALTRWSSRKAADEIGEASEMWRTYALYGRTVD